MMPPPPGGGPEKDPIDLPGTGKPAQPTPPQAAQPPNTAQPAAPRPDDPPPEPKQYGPPPELMEMLEFSLRAAFTPDTVFTSLRDRSTPDVFTMLLNIMAWTLGAMLIAMVFTFMALPSASGLGLLPSILAVLGGLIAAIPLSFIGAGVLHGLSMLAGGKGDYARSYEIVSLLGCVAPITAVILFLPVPLIWLTPTIFLTYLCIRGVELMHRCYGMSVVSTVGFFGIAMLALQFASHKKIENFKKDIALRATLYSTKSDAAPLEEGNNASSAAMPDSRAPGTRPMGTSHRTPERSPSPYGNSSPSSLTMPKRTSGNSGSLGFVQRGVEAGRPAVPNALGNGIGVRRGSQAGYAPQPSHQGPPDAAQTDSLAESVLNMLNSRMRNNPDMLKQMSPQQQAQFKKMLKQANKYKNTNVNFEDADTRRMLQDMAPQIKRAGKKKPKRRRRRRKRSPPPPTDDEDTYVPGTTYE